jgi:hypothetical protein
MLFGSYRQFHQECYTDALTSVDAVRYSTDMMTLATMATAQPEALLGNNTTMAQEEEWDLRRARRDARVKFEFALRRWHHGVYDFSSRPNGAPGRTLQVIEGILGTQIFICCDAHKAGWRPGGKGTNCCATQKAGRTIHGPTGAKEMAPQTTMKDLHKSFHEMLLGVY